MVLQPHANDGIAANLETCCDEQKQRRDDSVQLSASSKRTNPRLATQRICNARALTVTAVVTFPSLVPLLQQEIDDCQRRDSVDPPSVKKQLGAESDNDDERKIAAGYRLNGIGA
jgi:hypothetical protein